jgi:hypothetical protein
MEANNSVVSGYTKRACLYVHQGNQGTQTLPSPGRTGVLESQECGATGKIVSHTTVTNHVKALEGEQKESEAELMSNQEDTARVHFADGSELVVPISNIQHVGEEGARKAIAHLNGKEYPIFNTIEHEFEWYEHHNLDEEHNASHTST